MVRQWAMKSVQSVVPSAQQKQFLFYVDDNLRTVQATWLGKNWSTDAVETTYYICGVVEKVGGKLELGHGEKFKKCPYRWVTGTAEMGITNAENPPVKLLNVSEHALVYPDADVISQVYPHNPDVFIMTQPPPGCAKSFLKVHHGSKSFLQVCKTCWLAAGKFHSLLNLIDQCVLGNGSGRTEAGTGISLLVLLLSIAKAVLNSVFIKVEPILLSCSQLARPTFSLELN